MWAGIHDNNSTKDLLSKAMKIIVKESDNRRNKGFSENNGAGLTLKEIAAILS
jgi:hypothetical protein